MASTDPYLAGQTPDFAGALDPFQLFATWLGEAVRSEPNDPNAMSVATTDASGMPNVRMVLLKGVDPDDRGRDRGFLFYTNLEGTKGRELLASPKAALNFHWKSLRRQVRIRGSVTVVSDAEADAYFASRPRGSQIGAWASQQSRPLESRFALEKAVASFTAKHGFSTIPRPQHWSGFRVTPLEMEFWADRPFRLHDRLSFKRSAIDAAWTTSRLYP